MGSVVLLVTALTFVHYVGAQMRAAPVLPLYAAASGATATGVGLIMGVHMAAAAVGSIPLGWAADVWGRRPLLLCGMIVGVATSLLLPLVEGELALITIYGLAGFGVAAFTPSALAMVGAAAAPGKTGAAFAWYSTAHYGAIAIGPFLGGLVAHRWGYRAAFVLSAVVIGIALAGAAATPAATGGISRRRSAATFADLADTSGVWAGWIVAGSGFLVQGVVFAFLPLLTHERGLTPDRIGLVFLVLGLSNTAARFPPGWLVDRTGRCPAYAVGGALIASVLAALLPHVGDGLAMLVVVALFGAVSGAGFVAVATALAASATPAARGLVMGGYSTSLYLGLAVGSFTLGPVIAWHGWVVGFAAGGVLGALGAVVAACLWASRAASRDEVVRA